MADRKRPTVVNSRESLAEFVTAVSELWQTHKYLRITVKTGRDRTLDQNDISHVWYDQISREVGEATPLEVKSFCKLMFGVGILRAEDPEFRALYDASIKRTLTYDQKLAIMAYFPVTSLFTTAQFSQYLERMQDYYRSHHNVTLEFPE